MYYPAALPKPTPQLTLTTDTRDTPSQHTNIRACTHTRAHTHTPTQHSPSGSADPTCSNDFFLIS